MYINLCFQSWMLNTGWCRRGIGTLDGD